MPGSFPRATTAPSAPGGHGDCPADVSGRRPRTNWGWHGAPTRAVTGARGNAPPPRRKPSACSDSPSARDPRSARRRTPGSPASRGSPAADLPPASRLPQYVPHAHVRAKPSPAKKTKARARTARRRGQPLVTTRSSWAGQQLRQAPSRCRHSDTPREPRRETLWVVHWPLALSQGASFPSRVFGELGSDLGNLLIEQPFRLPVRHALKARPRFAWALAESRLQRPASFEVFWSAASAGRRPSREGLRYRGVRRPPVSCCVFRAGPPPRWRERGRSTHAQRAPLLESEATR